MNMTCELNIGSRRELFVDRLLIDRLDNTHLKLHEPVSGGVALAIDKPWEGPANFGMSVIDVGDRLLMYYRGWPANDAKDENGVGCVAESSDGGATWTKPALNLVRRPDWPATTSSPPTTASRVSPSPARPGSTPAPACRMPSGSR